MSGKEFLKFGKFGKDQSVKIKYLLIIAVLCLSFSVAFILRAYPVKYGTYLNEFDPFFDFRATQYIVDHGINAYFKWHDSMSWYPEGRNVPTTSQSGLHITAAALYKIFGFNTSLLDFVIWFPVVIGSLSVALMFLLVRSITGKDVPGLIASVFFAVSPAIIQRGNLGWFKSEPLGIFYGLGGAYLFISALREKKYKFLIPKAIFSGVILGLALASWGGGEYFVIPIAIFIFILAFVSKDLKNPLLVSILFTISIFLVALSFPRPGISFVFGLPGILLMGSTVFLFVSTLVKRKSSEKNAIRNTAIIFGIFVILGVGIIYGGLYKSPSFRYLNAINPFLSSQNSLVQSVAEHSTPTIVDYFKEFSILIIFSGLGTWIAFKNKNNPTMIFALIIGLTGIYISATFARLLVFASISMVILSSIGIYELIRSITSIRRDTEKQDAKMNQNNAKSLIKNKIKSKKYFFVYMAFSAILIVLLTIPMIYDSNSNWISSADVPTSLANGGTNYRVTTNDWIDALHWISKNTPKDSVIASWWDYGYWITSLGNRTTLADNATINSTRIAAIAKMFISPEQEGWKIANNLKANYILIYVVGQKLPAFDPTNKSPIFILGGGGDESKKHWFITIGGFNETNYSESDLATPKQKFLDSLLGHMMPFKTIGYYDPNRGMLSPTYKPGTTPFYVKDIKYPKGNSSEPLTLAYASKSFESNTPGLFFGVLLYKVNHNFTFDNKTQINSSKNSTIENSNKTALAAATSTQVTKKITTALTVNNKSNIINNNNISSDNMTANKTNNTADIETSQGQIKIQFFPNEAPNHVKNFQTLAKKGFYDGVVFHRLVKGFVIQAGDQNTKNDSNREAWGTGGPGYTINEEFNNISHDRGIISMARTADPNSAGSQFFIVLNDSKFLDNQYTVFGKVIQGMDVVDKIANVPTNAMDQPKDPNLARINKIIIN
ncbi:MAG: peptidylprolyl isomerase [Thermoproteota archaeon]|nr:peptidylprolyl isomerase [Thermoproteota archaeon]